VKKTVSEEERAETHTRYHPKSSASPAEGNSYTVREVDAFATTKMTFLGN
jgi:hypothetical protein